MILVHIITESHDQAKEIALKLLSEKLIVSATLIEKTTNYSSENGVIEETCNTLVLGKTKAMLFDSIDRLLRELYPADMPVLYSIPIVNMDWEQAELLRSNTWQV